MTTQEKKRLNEHIKSQIDSLKEDLECKENFHTKDDWKKLSYITERGEESDEQLQSN